MKASLFIIVIIIFTIRIVNYGIYTMKDKNKAGAISLFVMSAMLVSTILYFFI